MTKLKLAAVPDGKPVNISLELPAAVHRDLVAYAEILARESGHPVSDPAKLVHGNRSCIRQSRKSFQAADGK